MSRLVCVCVCVCVLMVCVWLHSLTQSVSDPNPFQLHVSIPSRIRPLRTEFRLEIYQVGTTPQHMMTT